MNYEIIEKLNGFRAKKNLIMKYNYLIEVDKILEAYETHKILSGGLEDKQLAKSREALIEIQMRLTSEENFVNFLKTL